MEEVEVLKRAISFAEEALMYKKYLLQYLFHVTFSLLLWSLVTFFLSILEACGVSGGVYGLVALLAFIAAVVIGTVYYWRIGREANVPAQVIRITDLKKHEVITGLMYFATFGLSAILATLLLLWLNYSLTKLGFTDIVYLAMCCAIVCDAAMLSIASRRVRWRYGGRCLLTVPLVIGLVYPLSIASGDKGAVVLTSSFTFSYVMLLLASVGGYFWFMKSKLEES